MVVVLGILRQGRMQVVQVGAGGCRWVGVSWVVGGIWIIMYPQVARMQVLAAGEGAGVQGCWLWLAVHG